MNKIYDPWTAVCLFLFLISVLILIGVVILTLRVHDANAQSWDWSPPAAHHAAACRVESGDKSGSGIYVKYGDLRGVLTVAHVATGGKATVKFSDGTKVTGKFVDDKFGHDVAFIFVSHPTILPVPMAEEDPFHGDRVELIAKGGPERRLRSFWGTKQDAGADVTKYDCDILSGDSGGGVLNTRGELIGIMAFGKSPRIANQSWSAYHGAGGVSCGRIRDFLRRIISLGKSTPPGSNPADKCGPNGCPLPSGGSQFYPPKNSKFVPVQKPARPAVQPRVKRQLPSIPPELSIDYGKLVEMILLRIDLEDFRGPVGPPGSIGKTGPRGNSGLPGRSGQPGPQAAEVHLDDLAERIKKRIQGSIRVKVRPVQPR